MFVALSTLAICVAILCFMWAHAPRVAKEFVKEVGLVAVAACSALGAVASIFYIVDNL